jgi:N6-adenosine-specific RNA methylase IME4
MKKSKKTKAPARPAAKRKANAGPRRKKALLKRTRDLAGNDRHAKSVVPRIAAMTSGGGKKLPSVIRTNAIAPSQSGASDALPSRPAGWKAGPATRDETAQPRRYAAQIKVGKRFRTEFGDIEGLAREFNDLGMLQPVGIDRDDALIYGERRLKAWEHPAHNLRGTPLPVVVVPLEDILAGEWAENDPARRLPFRPDEMVAIKRAMEAKLGPTAKARQGRAGKGVARSEPAEGEAVNVAQRVAAFAGRSAESIRKMEAVVDAAAAEPEKYGRLLDNMNKTGRADGPFKMLQNLKTAEAIRNAPAPLPGNGPYSAGMIDFPHAGEPEGDDPNRSGRGYYPYPTMNVAQQCDFMREQVEPLLAPNCVIGFWTTNYHLTFGHHLPVLESIGLVPRVILSFCKDIVGRGQVARGTVEFLVIASRGDVVIETFPATHFPFKVNSREHSRKDQAAFELFARHVPAPRYFSLFETVERGALWDCHGNKIPAPRAREEMEVVAELDPGTDFSEDQLQQQRIALEAIQRNGMLSRALVEMADLLRGRKWIEGKRKLKLTDAGQIRLGALRIKFERKPAPPAEEPAPIEPLSADEEAELAVLAAAMSGKTEGDAAVIARLTAEELLAGKKIKRINLAGRGRLHELRERKLLSDAWRQTPPQFPHGVPGHVVSMTTDAANNQSVGTCQCGAIFRAGRLLPRSGHAELDRLIDEHWTQVAPTAVRPAQEHPDAHRILNGRVWNEMPAPAQEAAA